MRIGRFFTRFAVAHSLRMLDSPDEKSRRKAASTLGRLGDEKAIEPLYHLVERESKPEYVEALVTLAKTKRNRSNDIKEFLYRQMLRFPNEALVNGVITMGSDKQQLSNDLYALVKTEGWSNATRALIRLGGDKGKIVGNTLNKLIEILPEHKAKSHLGEALAIGEEGYDFEVIYEPERAHTETREKWVWLGTLGTGTDAGSELQTISETIIDSPERIEIVKKARKDS